MLGALFHRLTTPAPRDLRRLGYVGRSVALWSRSRRCRKAWSGHLARSRAFIADAMAGATHRREAVVRGSGLLDDVPLERLAASFERVVLIDAVHPWPARLAARRFANVALVSADLTSFADRLLGRSGSLPEPPVARLCADAGFVVSANLLSQLPLVPLSRLGAREDGDALALRIVAAHLDALAALSACVCLIADVEQIEEDREGRELDRSDLLFGAAMPEPEARWTWELAPFGEVSRKYRLLHRVNAYADWTQRADAVSRGIDPRTLRASPRIAPTSWPGSPGHPLARSIRPRRGRRSRGGG